MKTKSIVMTLLFALTMLAPAAFASTSSKTVGASPAKTACCPGCPDCNGGSCCHHKM